MVSKERFIQIFKRNREKNHETLYNYKPPSLTWRKKVDFIKAEHSSFWRKVWEFYVYKTLKKRFATIRVRNSEAILKCNEEYPYIFYAQHSNWFDGMLGWVLCNELFDMPMNIMVEDLAKFPLLSQVGAFSICKKSPKNMLKVLNYCIDFLTKREAVLYIFPQGIIHPPGHRPLEFTHGTSYIINKLEKVNVIPVVPKFTFLRLGAPEILVDFGDPIIFNGDNNFETKEEVTAHMESEYIKILDAQEHRISNGLIDEYEIFYQKPDGVCKKLEKWFKSRF